MFRNASRHCLEVTVAALNDMHCLEGENNVTKKVTVEDLAVDAADIMETRDEQEMSDSDEEVPVSFAAHIESLSFARDTLQCYENFSE